MAYKTKTKTLAATALAAIGLSAFSPLQQAVVTLSLASAALWATPALAQNQIPGVGIVVKKKPGNAPIMAPSDANGNIVLTGLAAGEYELKLIGAAQATTVQVGRDGRLAVTAWEDKGRQWVEPLRINAAAPVRTEAFDVAALFGQSANNGLPQRGDAVANGRKQQGQAKIGEATARFIDVNSSSAADIVRLAPTTSAAAAQFIVADRAKGGPYKDPSDFANRVCANVNVDFEYAPTKIGDVQIIARGGGSPKDAGWRCGVARPGEKPTVDVFNKRYDSDFLVVLLP